MGAAPTVCRGVGVALAPVTSTYVQCMWPLCPSCRPLFGRSMIQCMWMLMMGMCIITPSPHHTKLHHTSPHHTKPHHTSPHQATPHHTTPHQATPHHTTPHHTTPHHTTPHLTSPYHTSPRQPSSHHTSLTHISPHLTQSLPTYPPFTRQISKETNAEVEIPRDPHLQNKLSQGTHSPVSHALKFNKHTPSRRALNWHTYVCTVLHCVCRTSAVRTYSMYARMYVCTCIRTCIQHVMKPYLVTYVCLSSLFLLHYDPSPPPLPPPLPLPSLPLSPPLLTSISPPPIIPLFPFSPPLSTVLRPTAGQSRARQPSLMSSVS